MLKKHTRPHLDFLTRGVSVYRSVTAKIVRVRDMTRYSMDQTGYILQMQELINKYVDLSKQDPENEPSWQCLSKSGDTKASLSTFGIAISVRVNL